MTLTVRPGPEEGPAPLDKPYWELREPSFPHYTWRIYQSGRVERWDGQLVRHRPATEDEKAALLVSFRCLLNWAEAIKG